MINKHIKKITLGLALLLGSSVAMAECGSVQVASMNWASAELLANVDRIVLEAGFDCSVEMVPGDTVPTFTSMNEKSQPDLAGELWANAFVDKLDQAIAEGRLITANPEPIAGVGEGWWISPETASKHPQLKTVLDVLDHPELFPDVEDSSKGAFVTCPSGWGCQLSNANLFRAFDMAKKGWKLLDPGSGAGLDGSMTKAVERGENWFGYYWAPTALIGKHKMVKLDYGVPFAGKENWDGCIALSEQECADPKPSAWTVSEVRSVVTADFKKRAGSDVLNYLGKRVFPSDVIGDMLVYMAENQADGVDAATEFFLQYENVWENWVSSAVAKKIKASL